MVIKSCFPNGFKIRSFATLNDALRKYITKEHEHGIKLHERKALFLTVGTDGKISVSLKDGDIYDPWNPSVSVPDDGVLHTLWNYRKQLNEYFFPNH